MKLCIASCPSLLLGSLLLSVPGLALGSRTTAAAVPADPIAFEPMATTLTPGMHGTGRGLWDGPDEGLGRLFVKSTVKPAGPTFVFDAHLARIVPIGPHGPGIEGTLFGEMRRIGSTAPVAILLGGWTQDEDGLGTFFAQVLVATGDADVPFATVGYVGGSFQTPPPDSGAPDEGEAFLRWNVSG